MLRTFFRHYSLYEYSFKPKVDLVLMTVPKDHLERSKANNASQMSTLKKSVDHADGSKSQVDMEGVSAVGADAGNKSIDSLDADAAVEKKSVTINEEQPVDDDKSAAKVEPIDWEKVGKIYKPESAIEDIIAKEMNRL